MARIRACRPGRTSTAGNEKPLEGGRDHAAVPAAFQRGALPAPPAVTYNDAVPHRTGALADRHRAGDRVAPGRAGALVVRVVPADDQVRPVLLGVVTGEPVHPGGGPPCTRANGVRTASPRPHGGHQMSWDGTRG
ncbi:hypothetical protein [Streptomyces sp. TE33382]